MEFDLLTGLTQSRLENRLCIWHKKIAGDNTVSLRLVINGGSAHQKLDELGLAHFVEHLVFNFEDERSGAKQIVAEIEQSGGYVNAVTDLDSTVFVAEIPVEKLGRCLELIETCISNPDFSEETIHKEKQIILNELANEDSDFWNSIYRKVLGNCALAHSGIGTPQTLKGIGKGKIEGYFNKYYVLNKMTLICVGDVECEAMRDLSVSKIKRLRCNSELWEHYACPVPREGFLKISVPRAENSIIYGFRVSGSLSQNKEFYALWLIRDYLDKQLFNFVREKGLSYSSEVCYSVNNTSGLFYFYVRYIKKGRREVVKKFVSHSNDLREKLLDDTAFNECKTEVVNQYLRYLSDRKEMADCYQQYAQSCEDIKDIKNDIQELRALTPDDIQRLASKYFVKDRIFEVRGSFIKAVSRLLLPFLAFIILSSLLERVIKADSPGALKILLLSTAVLAGLVVWLLIDRLRLQNMLVELRKEIQERKGLSK